jgi:hypothetical protein
MLFSGRGEIANIRKGVYKSTMLILDLFYTINSEEYTYKVEINTLKGEQYLVFSTMLIQERENVEKIFLFEDNLEYIEISVGLKVLSEFSDDVEKALVDTRELKSCSVNYTFRKSSETIEYTEDLKVHFIV